MFADSILYSVLLTRKLIALKVQKVSTFKGMVYGCAWREIQNSNIVYLVSELEWDCCFILHDNHKAPKVNLQIYFYYIK